MKPKPVIRHPAGYTIVEICIALAILTVVGGAAYAMLMSSTTLLAKNLSLNSSNIVARAALDRIYSELNQANQLPILIDADGTPTGGTTPAAGILVDRYLGGPYIVGNPGSGLPSSATTFNLFYSTDPLASPPIPAKNDVVLIGSARALVLSSSVPSSTFASPAPTPGPVPGGRMTTVTLSSPLSNYTVPPGTGVSWNAGTQQTASLVHRRAFLVVPVNGTNGPAAQLRMYPDAEAVTNYDDSSKYVVLTHTIGTNTVAGLTEHTPFSLVTQDGATFLKIAMRVEDQQFNKRLANQQAKEFNTFLRLDTLVRPRNAL